MKMKYEKPMVAVERYELSQSIASCAIKMGPSGTNYCILNNTVGLEEMRDWAYHGYFTGSAGGCDFTPDIDQEFDGICFHTQATATFIS